MRTALLCCFMPRRCACCSPLRSRIQVWHRASNHPLPPKQDQGQAEMPMWVSAAHF